jgi:hypothetical protein
LVIRNLLEDVRLEEANFYSADVPNQGDRGALDKVLEINESKYKTTIFQYNSQFLTLYILN